MEAAQVIGRVRLRRMATAAGWPVARTPVPHLARLATQLSLHLRWVPMLAALFGYIAGERVAGALPLAAAIALFNAALYLLSRRGWRLSPFLLAVVDCLCISALVAQRGGVVSESYLLYALPVVYLGLYYAWPGALAGFGLNVLSYAATFYLTDGVHPATPDFDLRVHLLVRAAYFVFTTVIVSIVVREQEQHQRRVTDMHERLREQVRRLQAIQRITEKLNTAPSRREIDRIIIGELRGVIPFRNCRIHRIEEGPEGVWLSRVAIYGQPIDEGGALAAGTEHLRLGEGITGWVALHAEPALVVDAAQDPRALHVPGTSATPNSLLAVPVMVNRRVKGVIVLSQVGAQAFSPDDLQMMVTLANAAAIAIDNIESRESLARQARTDAVTGLPHHGAFLSALTTGLEAALQAGEPLSLALVDIDGFRGYNERMGLAAGDRALRYVGSCLEAACSAACTRLPASETCGDPADAEGPAAQCFRLGGDEFALLLRGPLAPTETAVALLRDAIRRVDGGEVGPRLRRVTIAAGLATFPCDARSRRDLLEAADAALYLVRQTGGNRLALFEAAARETLDLRHRLEDMIRAGLAESGSATAVQQIVAEAASRTQQARHAGLAAQMTTEALRALAAAIDAKDDYTRGHSERVAATANELARQLDLPAALVGIITTAAHMHDIGKIAVPDQILHKRSALTPFELSILAAHPQVGADILAPIHTLREVLPIVRHHHERYDGHGYPDRLAGDSIPIGARVVAVADTIDAMITDRPYRRGLCVASALAELQQGAGSHFDPEVVAAALALYGPGGTGLALHGVRPAPDPPHAARVPASVGEPTLLDAMMHPKPASVSLDHALLQVLQPGYETHDFSPE